jgi:hypothetical protein
VAKNRAAHGRSQRVNRVIGRNPIRSNPGRLRSLVQAGAGGQGRASILAHTNDIPADLPAEVTARIRPAR